jgi:hypothetical protein
MSQQYMQLLNVVCSLRCLTKLKLLAGRCPASQQPNVGWLRTAAGCCTQQQASAAHPAAGGLGKWTKITLLAIAAVLVMPAYACPVRLSTVGVK